MSNFSTDFTLGSKNQHSNKVTRQADAPRYKNDKEDFIRCKVVLNSKVLYTVEEIKEMMFKKPLKVTTSSKTFISNNNGKSLIPARNS